MLFTRTIVEIAVMIFLLRDLALLPPLSLAYSGLVAHKMAFRPVILTTVSVISVMSAVHAPTCA